jgi:class 3 adenylate cyclase
VIKLRCIATATDLMRFRLKPSIGNTIFALAGILIALMAIVAAFNTTMSMRVGELVGAISRTYVPVYGMLARAHIRSLEQSLALRQAAISMLSQDEQRFQALLIEEVAAGSKVVEELANARSAVAVRAGDKIGVDDRVQLGRLDAQIEAAVKERVRYDRQRAELVAAFEAKDIRAAQLALDKLDAIRDQQNEHFEQTRRESLAFATHAVELTQESGRDVVRLTLLMLAFAILLGLLMAFWLTRRVVSAIRRLVVATEAVERGHYDTELPVTSQDEIGSLSRAFNAMLADLRLKAKIRDTFGRYMDPKVVAGLLERPELSGNAGNRRLMTVVFADMRGFTALSEEVTPALLVTLLNRYLTVLSEEVRARNGVVDKYIGDSVMAFWGPPFVPEAQQARLACEAAVAQIDRFAAFKSELPELAGIRSYAPDVGLRIGIATGEVIAGNVGSDVAMNYTVMGDAVNLASRLEGLNKHYGTAVLISESTARLAGPEISMREVDTVRVPGRDAPVTVFEVMGRADDLPPDTARLISAYSGGLAAYRSGDWNSAAARFRECLAIRPGDGPASTMLARLETFEVNPPAVGWDSIWAVTQK